MQKVSKAYKKSMSSSLRERAYMMITFGLINQEAQAKATIDEAKFSLYSNKSTIFENEENGLIYATLEENFTKTDGSMLFLPRKKNHAGYFDTGIISEKMLTEEPFEMTIQLNTTPIDFKGLSINFGDNYPVNFDIISSQGQVLEFRNNDKANWQTEKVLNNTTSITFKFYDMKYPNNRLRIYSILFGYGLMFQNKEIMDSTLKSYVSPIGADVPQIDFEVKLKNYDKYFDVDNPDSAINYLEQGQEMTIMYGYDTPNRDGIEWIRGSVLICSAWESDDKTAVIKCQDIFRNMESVYYKGRYSPIGRTYFDLAKDVLDDAGIEKYYIDPRLKHIKTNNPIPRVMHKEALQIIANACRCILVQSRNGFVQIKSNFTPIMSATSNGETTYSNVVSILKNEEPKKEYASLMTNYASTDGSMYFLPRNHQGSLYTGYVSDVMSNAEGLFETNPRVTISAEAIRTYYGIKLEFGKAVPSEFKLTTYNNNNLVKEFEYFEDEIEKTTVLLDEFEDCDKIVIEFIKTAEPHNRIVLNYFSVSDIVNFTMSKKDMMSSPKVMKQELIKDVVVPCYVYQTSSVKENLVYEDVSVTNGQLETYYINDASYGYKPKLNGNTGQVEVVESGSYYVTLRYLTNGNYKLEVEGYRYKIVEKQITKPLHVRGKTITWKNPLISNMTVADDLAEWLAEYYTAGVEYEYETRGNPEIDITDIIYQENDYFDDMKVNVYKSTLNFAQGFSGRVTTRRIGG